MAAEIILSNASKVLTSFIILSVFLQRVAKAGGIIEVEYGSLCPGTGTAAGNGRQVVPFDLDRAAVALFDHHADGISAIDIGRSEIVSHTGDHIIGFLEVRGTALRTGISQLAAKAAAAVLNPRYFKNPGGGLPFQQTSLARSSTGSSSSENSLSVDFLNASV